MKTRPILCSLAAVLLSVSCTQPGIVKGPFVEKLVFTVEDFETAGEGSDPALTKTSIINNGEFIWAAEDTVGIYPNTGSQVYFAMTSGAGASSAEFDGGGWDFKSESEYYSYYPFIGDIYLDRHHIPVSYTGQVQDGIYDVEHIGPYDHMYTGSTSSSNSTLNFSYKHLNCIIRPNVTLPAGTYTKLAITAPSAVFAVEGYYDLQSASPTIVPTKYAKQISIDLEDVTLTEPTTFYVYLVSAPVNLKGVEITVSVLDSEKREYQCKKTPSIEYGPKTIGGLTCSSWTEASQSMRLIK